MNLKPSEVIYIGDSISDYKVCLNAGIDFGYATWGSVSNEGIHASLVLQDPLEILELI